MIWDIKKVPAIKTPKLLRECFAEFVGMFLIIFFGNGSVAQLVTIDNKSNSFQLTFCWACGVFLGVLISGGISGGHLNPVVTICLCFTHNFPWLKAVFFIFAQFLGAFMGAATIYGIYRPSILNYDKDLTIPPTAKATAGIFATYPLSYITTDEAVLNEVLATSVLVFVVYFMAEKMDKYSLLCKSFTVAMTVWVIGSSVGSQTGYALNPARDFGPRLFSCFIYGKGVFTASKTYFWIPIIAPILGGFLAIVVYFILIGFQNEEAQEIQVVEEAELEGGYILTNKCCNPNPDCFCKRPKYSDQLECNLFNIANDNEKVQEDKENKDDEENKDNKEDKNDKEDKSNQENKEDKDDKKDKNNKEDEDDKKDKNNKEDQSKKEDNNNKEDKNSKKDKNNKEDNKDTLSNKELTSDTFLSNIDELNEHDTPIDCIVEIEKSPV